MSAAGLGLTGLMGGVRRGMTGLVVGYILRLVDSETTQKKTDSWSAPESSRGIQRCIRSEQMDPLPSFAMCFLAILGRVWSDGPVFWLHRTTMKYKTTVVQSYTGLRAEFYRICSI